MDERASVNCTLYCYPFSLYSIMVRYLIQLAKNSGVSHDATSSTLRIRERALDLDHDENIAEWYLLNINRKGQVCICSLPIYHSPFTIEPFQVPAMTVEGKEAPITDSLDISYWLCDMLPQFLPPQYEATIRRLLRDLHAIEGISVTIRRREGPEEDLIDPCVDNMLARDDISPEYRQALESKKIL